MSNSQTQNNLPVTTDKMPKETRRQYAAWLLYCEVNSLRKVYGSWEKVRQKFGESSADWISDLQKRPSLRMIEKWSSKYGWVERADTRLAEELTEMKERADKFRAKRRYVVTDILMKKMYKLQKQSNTEEATVKEVESLWGMHRSEYGESSTEISHRHHIDESKQVPPTPEEDEVGQAIDEVIINSYDKKCRDNLR